MLIVFCAVIAILIAIYNGKVLKHTKYYSLLVYMMWFIFFDEIKMPLMYMVPQLVNYLFLYVIVQYTILFLLVIKYMQNINATFIAWGALLNFSVISSNSSLMPVSSKMMDIGIMNSFAKWMQGSTPGYFIMHSKVTLWFVGDVIPIPMFNTGLLSPGDMLIALGVSFLLYSIIPNKEDMRIPKHARKKNSEA